MITGITNLYFLVISTKALVIPFPFKSTVTREPASRNLKMDNLTKLFAFCACLFLVLISYLQTIVESKAQYVQPVLMGMQVALPYDIANIWNRPVSFAPYVSTFCGLSVLYIIFFGVITSPFGYMFGVPSQKYVLGTNGTDSLFTIMLQVAEQMDSEGNADEGPRNFARSLTRKLIQLEWEYPEFSESVFKFIPNTVKDNSACLQLILCHAHSALRSLPQVTASAYRVFSKMVINVDEEHRKAIKIGLDEEARCEDKFQNCPSDIQSLMLKMILEAFPEWLRRNLILPRFSV